MSLRPSRYLLNGVVFLYVLSEAAYRTNAQQTNATCDRSFDWANNSKGQSPCLVAAYLQGQCFGNKQWNVSPLQPGTQYLAPTGDEATGCACASPVYSLISACAACQGASYVSWGQWTANCPAARVNNGTFPFQVPTDTVIPQWALDKIGSDAYLDLDAAYKKVTGDTGLSGATIFLIVLLPIILIGVGGFGLWMLWKRKQRRARRMSLSGKEPLLSHSGSRTTFLSVDTTSDVHIHLTQNSLDSGHGYGYDKPWPQSSPTPRTPESAGYSPHPILSPGAQYPPTYQPHQQFLVPPSAATSAGFTAPYHPHPSPGLPPAPPSAAVRPLSQPPHTGATTQTFASQQNEFGSNSNRQSYPGPSPTPEVENDSGTFPRAPVEPQLPSLPLGDPRRLLPPSVRANAPST